MAPSTWLNRLCSAPGEDQEGEAELVDERSRCTGRLLISRRSEDPRG